MCRKKKILPTLLGLSLLLSLGVSAQEREQWLEYNTSKGCLIRAFSTPLGSDMVLKRIDWDGPACQSGRPVQGYGTMWSTTIYKGTEVVSALTGNYVDGVKDGSFTVLVVGQSPSTKRWNMGCGPDAIGCSPWKERNSTVKIQVPVDSPVVASGSTEDATKFLEILGTAAQSVNEEKARRRAAQNSQRASIQSSSNGSQYASNTLSQNGRESGGDTTSSRSSDNGKIYDGLVTDNCVRYKPLEVRSNASWFQFTNGCSEPIKVFWGNAGSRLTSLAELSPGQSTKSWYLNTKTNGIHYRGCKVKINGKPLHLDEESGRCYHF